MIEGGWKIPSQICNEEVLTLEFGRVSLKK